MIFGEKLRRLMKQHRYSQDALAREMGVSQGLVSGWCSQRYVPDIYQGRQLATLLGVTLDFLLDETKDDSEPTVELPLDELLILDTYRSLRLSKDTAIQALLVAAMNERAGLAPVAPGPAKQLPVRDMTEYYQRLEQERKDKERQKSQVEAKKKAASKTKKPSSDTPSGVK